jgi:hypothetical protein
VDRINAAQDMDCWQAIVHIVMNPWVPQMARSFLISSATINFTRTLLHGDRSDFK